MNSKETIIMANGIINRIKNIHHRIAIEREIFKMRTCECCPHFKCNEWKESFLKDPGKTTCDARIKEISQKMERLNYRQATEKERKNHKVCWHCYYGQQLKSNWRGYEHFRDKIKVNESCDICDMFLEPEGLCDKFKSYKSVTIIWKCEEANNE